VYQQCAAKVYRADDGARARQRERALKQGVSLQLRSRLIFLPLNSEAMLRAAELWAESRSLGKTTADPKELDGDVILAAQALQIGGTVVTENPGHLALIVRVEHWLPG
jgi:predicted nucleic acid-binding protein